MNWWHRHSWKLADCSSFQRSELFTHGTSWVLLSEEATQNPEEVQQEEQDDSQGLHSACALSLNS